MNATRWWTGPRNRQMGRTATLVVLGIPGKRRPLSLSHHSGDLGVRAGVSRSAASPWRRANQSTFSRRGLCNSTTASPLSAKADLSRSRNQKMSPVKPKEVGGPGLNSDHSPGGFARTWRRVACRDGSRKKWSALPGAIWQKGLVSTTGGVAPREPCAQHNGLRNASRAPSRRISRSLGRRRFIERRLDLAEVENQLTAGRFCRLEMNRMPRGAKRLQAERRAARSVSLPTRSGTSYSTYECLSLANLPLVKKADVACGDKGYPRPRPGAALHWRCSPSGPEWPNEWLTAECCLAREIDPDLAAMRQSRHDGRPDWARGVVASVRISLASLSHRLLILMAGI